MKVKFLIISCLSFMLFSCSGEDSNPTSTRGKGPREIQENSSNDHGNDKIQNTSDSITTQY